LPAGPLFVFRVIGKGCLTKQVGDYSLRLFVFGSLWRHAERIEKTHRGIR
jgi:hypothetical protein